MQRLELRPVLIMTHPVQLSMAEDVLREAGIPFDRHANVLNTTEDPFNFTSHQRIQLRVRAEDLARARELLRRTVGEGLIEDPA